MDSIHLEAEEIPYIHNDSWTNFQDVVILSDEGQEFGFNKCMLASLSYFCKNLFMELYECPMANLDEKVYMSSNLSAQELQTLSDYFLSGSKKVISSSVLQTLGVNLSKIKPEVKLEEEEEDYEPTSMDVDPEYLEDSKIDYYESEEEEEDIKPKPKKRKVKETKAKTAGSKRKELSKPQMARKGDFATLDNKENFFSFPQEGKRELSKPYQCHRCVRGFWQVHKYRMHFHRHDLGCEDYERAFYCFQCGNWEGGSEKDLTEHRKKQCTVLRQNDNTSKFKYYCLICTESEIFKNTKDLLSHHKKLHSELVIVTESQTTGGAFCPACGVEQASANCLRLHYKKEGPHHKEAKCSFCLTIRFTSWSDHKAHLDECHNGVLRYPCGHCGQNYFLTKKEQANHKIFCKIHPASHPLEQYPGGKDVSCTICFEQVGCNQHSIRKHLIDNHPTVGEKCKICQDTFFSKTAMETHMRNIHMKIISCDQCDKKFSTHAQLRDHQLSHTEKFDFVCVKCGTSFQRKGQLVAHEKFVHQGYRPKSFDKKITCEKCGVEMLERNYRRTHKNVCQVKVSAEFTCKECGSMFKNKQSMKSHINRHHVKVTCQHCGKSMGQSLIYAHMKRYHTAETEMPYFCTVCQKGFVAKRKYQDHMNIHTGERPHNCKFCTKTFADKSNCSKHMRESHKEEYNKLKAKNASDN